MSCICRPNACVLPFPHLFRTDEIKGGGGEKRHLKPLACKMTATPTNLKLLALLALLGLAAAALPVTPGASVSLNTAHAAAAPGKPNARAENTPAKGNSSHPRGYNTTAAHLDESSGVKRNGTFSELKQRPHEPNAHEGTVSQRNESSGVKGKGSSSEPAARPAGTRQPAAANSGGASNFGTVTVLGASSTSSNPKPGVVDVRAASTAGRTQPTAASTARTQPAAGPAAAGKTQAAPVTRPTQGATPPRAG